jgi:hypothetical protein
MITKDIPKKLYALKPIYTSTGYVGTFYYWEKIASDGELPSNFTVVMLIQILLARYFYCQAFYSKKNKATRDQNNFSSLDKTPFSLMPSTITLNFLQLSLL